MVIISEDDQGLLINMWPLNGFICSRTALELELNEHAVLSARKHRPLLSTAGQCQRVHIVAAAQLALSHLLTRNLDQGANMDT